MGVNLLGPVTVDGDGDLRPRDRLALGALAVRRGLVVSPDQLSDAIWADDPPASSVKQVQICVGRIRKVLGADAIETTAGGYRLALTGDDVDVDRFEALVERGHDFAATGEPDRAVTAFRRALAVWRGRPYEELDGWPPGRSEATRLEELRRAVEEDLLRARLDTGDHRGVAADAGTLVAEEPLRERRWAILALALYRGGRQAEALRALATARTTLVEQLGIEPSAELVELEAAILRQDAGLEGAPAPATVSTDCPYKGLAPYDVGDGGTFFGRSAEVDQLLNRLRDAKLVVVAGPSGGGKSSLVRAGLVPALLGRGREVVVLQPGTDPITALTTATSSTEQPPIVIIDQFEEVFTLGASTDDVRETLEWIADYATGRAPVVITIRADQLVGLSDDPAFSRLAEQGLHLVAPLSGDHLREAIEGPAAQAGLRLEPGLVDLLVRDTEGEPGALPLLSHALAETWRRRDGNVLTVEGYRSTGGISGAVARSADRLYESLPSGQRSTLRSILLRLVGSSPDGEAVRFRVDNQTLRGDPDRERVISLLVGARLVTTEANSVELAHEALARAWPRLRSWLDEDAAGQRILRHLAAAAVGWDSLGRPESELYRGARLEAALEWRDTDHPDLTETEAAFLDTSVADADVQRTALEARAARDARQNRRLRGLLVGAAVLSVIALVAGALALTSRNDAADRADAARRAESEAQLESLVGTSLALRQNNRAIAALLAVEAHRRAPGTLARSALFGTFTGAPGFLGYQQLPAENRVDGAVIPGSDDAVVALDGRQLAILDVGTGGIEERFGPYDGGPLDETVTLNFSDDGRRVAQLIQRTSDVRCTDREAIAVSGAVGCAVLNVFDVANGQRILGPLTPPVGPGDVALDADGSTVAVAGGYNGDVAVLSLSDRTSPTDQDDWALLQRPPRPAGFTIFRDTAAVDFGPDRRLYAGSMAGPVDVIDPATMAVIDRFDAPESSSHNQLSVGPDGLLVAGGEGAIVAIDTSTGSTRWVSEIGDGSLGPNQPFPCPTLAVTWARGAVYCGSFVGMIHELDLDTGLRTDRVLDTQMGSTGQIDVTSSGELVAFSQDAPVASRFRLDGSGPVTRTVARGHVTDAYSQNGRELMVIERASVLAVDQDPFPADDLAVWDPERDVMVDPLDGFVGIWSGGRQLVGTFTDGHQGVYDLHTRRRVDVADTGALDTGEQAEEAWFSAPAERLYVWILDGPTRFGAGHIAIWDTNRQERLDMNLPVEGQVLSMSASRDGDRVVVTTYRDFIAMSQQAETRNETTVFDGHTGDVVAGPIVGPWTSAVSSDGTLLGTVAGRITEYDLETGKAIGDFPGESGAITGMEFSHDGRTVMVTSNDQSVSVYDVGSRSRIGDPVRASAPAGFEGSLRADGGAMAVTDEDGVAIWDLDPDHLAEASCAVAGRNLTPTEWATYMTDFGPHRKTCRQYD